MNLNFRPSIFKSVTLPFTILILFLVLGSEIWFRFKYEAGFFSTIEHQGKLNTVLWLLAKTWLAQILFIPAIIGMRNSATEVSVSGYNDYFKWVTIDFYDIDSVKKTQFRIISAIG